MNGSLVMYDLVNGSPILYNPTSAGLVLYDLVNGSLFLLFLFLRSCEC